MAVCPPAVQPACCAYVALFPQLIAGPIVRYSDIAAQLEHRTTTWDDVAYGLRRFLLGLGKSGQLRKLCLDG